MGGIDLLKQKLADYTKRYYQQRALRGLLLWLGVFLTSFLALALAEYFFRFHKGTRLVLFWTYSSLFISWFIVKVIVPLLRTRNLIKGMSFEDAALQIGNQEKGLDDKILNTLGLSQLNLEEDQLVMAAINQKVDELRSFDFKSFVDFKEIRKTLPFSLIPLLLILAFSLSETGREVLQSSQRVVLYNEDFRPPAPFNFVFERELYKVELGKSVSVKVALEGQLIPERLEAKLNGVKVPAIKLGEGLWRLDIEQVQEDTRIIFEALAYESKAIQIEVIESPSFSAFEIEIVPPAYTGLNTERLNLSPDLRVAEGSELKFKAIGLKSVRRLILEREADDFAFEEAKLSLRALKNFQYDLKAEGSEMNKTLLKGARISIIKDQLPDITASFSKDSIQENNFWVQLDFNDDYGVSKLERVIEIDDKRFISQLKTDQRADRLNLDTLSQNKGFLRVFYRVWDNDAVNGPKSRESASVRVDFLSKKEQNEKISAQLSGFSEQMKEQERKRDSFQKSLEEINRAFNEQKSLAWQDQQEIKSLLQKMEQNQKRLREKKKELEKGLEKVSEVPEKKEAFEERLKEMDAAEKELEKLREEIEKLMEELNLDEMQKKLQELQQENKEQLRREQRMDELLKDLMFQRDLLQEAQNLKELSEKLEELSKKDDEKSSDIEEAKNELEESLEKLQEMAEDNQQLKESLSSEEFQKSAESAEQSMSDAKDSQEQGDSDAANQEEQEASESAQEMSQSLQSLMSSMQKQALEVNMESLRRILENLKQYSVDVEESGLEIQALGSQDPRFRDLLKEESRLMAGSEVIKDSLIVLAEKAPQVKDEVFKELQNLQGSLAKAQKELQEQGIAKASTEHQYSMMAANNLALMLDESLQNMMSMMAQKQKGNQNCEKPGNGKPKPGQMSEKLSQMGKKVDKLQKGNKSGKGKDGSKGKEVAEILAQQEALREMLQQTEEGESGNRGNKEGLLEDLDQMEDALLNEDFTLVKERFKRIESRMLESEKALEERKQKEEREAQEGKSLGMRQGQLQNVAPKEKRTRLDRYKRQKLKLNNFYYELKRQD